METGPGSQWVGHCLKWLYTILFGWSNNYENLKKRYSADYMETKNKNEDTKVTTETHKRSTKTIWMTANRHKTDYKEMQTDTEAQNVSVSLVTILCLESLAPM